MSAPSNYPGYYVPPGQQQQSPYPSTSISRRAREQQMNQAVPSPSSSSSIPIDPALSMYPSQYYSYQQSQQHLPGTHIPLPANLSSPSSQASEAMTTPPNDHAAVSGPSSVNTNGKRPASPRQQTGDGRKKSRKDDDGEEGQSPAAEKGDEAPKAKPTRGSRACTVCRRLKMKCVGAENGPPCKRCQAGHHECIFEESNRGKRSTKKHEILTRSLRKMERTLDTIFRSLGAPPSEGPSRSPSPPGQPPPSGETHPLLATPPGSPKQHHRRHSDHPPSSPKLPSLPDDSLNPLGLLAEASLANRRAQAGVKSDLASTALLTRTSEPSRMGVASDLYFKPGPMSILPLRRLYIERQIQPEMLNFVSTEEVIALFKIYFDHMNIHCGLLDPDFHTPALVCSRSPFLLTTICAIASRFYDARAELYPRLTELAKKLAFNVPAKGYKSVEVVQAYLLNTLWGCGPVERYEQDRTWMLLGMGIRMALDLNVHRRTEVPNPDSDEGLAREREIHNRERTWILCFILDRSFSAQMGKPYTIKEDFIIRNAPQWCQSQVAMPSDAHTACYADLQRILTRSLDLLYSGASTSSGLQEDCDYLLVIKTMETQLLAWQHEWLQIRKIANAEKTEFARKYSELSCRFYYHYAMLTINSFGLQNALQRSPMDIGHFFARCYSSAVACTTALRDEFGPLDYLKYAPDSLFVQGSYAVLSLLKYLRPEFKAFLDHEQKTIALVKDVANVFEGVAVGPLHTPALYSCFLRALISARIDPNIASASAAIAAATTNGVNGQTEPDDDAASMTNEGAPSETSVTHSTNPVPTPSAPNDPFADFFANGEMGPVADMSTFPPTMAPNPNQIDMSMLSMDSILSADFWDSVLVPGSSNTLEGLSNGFVYGAGGSGLITPRFWSSPLPSMPESRNGEGRPGEFMPDKADSAFNVPQPRMQTRSPSEVHISP
ncbi:uncharacterized protein LAESUDRAFT_722542 [Laetiporus sulphureus 93-53]|uniref:Zn(2)-C6 fungal-type domain-containing protein n=1 Tax=Laetiporus sulphureus 93-53 TaxID=1314785 RepID=A0A165FYB1_9APHY|nr:uncharacterized protein LAESUDRAFT_722542 [Laetiporus sulphureus 93-53]KZT09576.1 hypothetical protein LAESUDRAFT_722542 [Laetiporus sulphureus 93-53]